MYRNTDLTLIPSHLAPKRECTPKEVNPFIVAALYRNTGLRLIPSHLAPKRECTPEEVYPFSAALLYRNIPGVPNSNSKSFTH